MNVFYLTTGDRKRASTRYRVLYLKPYLEEQGFNCLIKQHNPLNGGGLHRIGNNILFLRNMLHAKNSDIVIVQKSTLSKRQLNILLKYNKKIVYDFDDAKYARQPWKKNKNIRNTPNLNRMLSIIPYVVAGSPELADYASKYCNNVFQAPTAIPRNQYIKFYKKSKSDRKKTVIGWIGNPENLWYLKQIEDTLSEVLTNNSSVELQIITSEQRSMTPLGERIGNDVLYQKWSEKKELDYLNQIDIGIRPLTNDEWSRAKGGFTSVIQCMGLGKPVIVSPVGMLTDIVKHNYCGFHANSNSEWIEYLEYLIDNPNTRKKMGNRAFERVGQKRFWTDQRASDVASIYNSIYS